MKDLDEGIKSPRRVGKPNKHKYRIRSEPYMDVRLHVYVLAL